MATNGHGLGFEQKLWSAADKMRNNMDAAEYKHVVLGLIFLKYISDSFEEVYNKLKKEVLSSKWTEDDEISHYTANTESANWAVAEKKEEYSDKKQ